MARVKSLFFLNLRQMFRAPLEALAAERIRKKHIRDYTYAETLPDHILRDVGITRDQITYAKRHAIKAGFGGKTNPHH